MVRGLAITITPDLISKVSTLPLGVKWNREEKLFCTASKKSLLLPNEEYIEDKNGVRRGILHYPWDKVAYYIMKYISCEGRLSVVYGYHFRLLHELRFKGDLKLYQRLNIPYFLLHSIRDMS